MVEVPLQWKLSVQGAEEVKSKLNDVNSQFQRGEISASDYSKELRAVNRDARTLVGTTTLQKNIFLATHPTFNLMSRAVSTLASASRTLLAITNAVNLARLAGQGISSKQMELESDIAKVLRAINRETDPEKLQEYREELAILESQLNDLKIDESTQKFIDTLTAIGVTGIAFKGAIDFIKSIKGLTFSGTSIIGMGALSGLLKTVSKLTIPAAVIEFLSLMGRQQAGDEEIATGWEALVEIFNNDLPVALEGVRVAFSTLWNEIITSTEIFVNTIIGAIEGLINSFISAINVIIRAYNSVAGKIGLSRISTLAAVSLPRLNLEAIKINTEGNNNEVQGPVQGFGGSAGNLILVQNIQGSILAENEVKRIADNGLKDSLKKRNFTGN